MAADVTSSFVPAPPPDDGVLVEGLFLAGARYNRTLRVLQPPRPKQMVDPLPAIHFEPVEHHTRDEETYECPLYKTATRAGVLSTTGASANFVVAVDIPTDRNPLRSNPNPNPNPSPNPNPNPTLTRILTLILSLTLALTLSLSLLTFTLPLTGTRTTGSRWARRCCARWPTELWEAAC